MIGIVTRRLDRVALPGAFGLAVLFCFLPPAFSGTLDPGEALPAPEDFGRLPLCFVENQGQLPDDVAYCAAAPDRIIYFTSDGITISLPFPEEGDASTDFSSLTGEEDDDSAPRPAARRWAVKFEFESADTAAAVSGLDAIPGCFNYFTGDPTCWNTAVPAYRAILYKDLWPGIDLCFRSGEEGVKYEFRVRPGADADRIRLTCRGASGVSLNPSGGLRVETPAGSFEDRKPVAWQEKAGTRVPVRATYNLDPAGTSSDRGFGFALGACDPALPLVIDPDLFLYCGFLGGDSVEEGRGIDVDSSGCIYVTGMTESTEATFPVTAGPFLVHKGAEDVFVAKLNPDGTQLLYCGYIGGVQNERSFDIVVDDSGYAYLVGNTYSSPAEGFPAVVGPELNFAGGQDAFVAKLSQDGMQLLYCGYIGGARADYGRGLSVDDLGNVYIMGRTISTEVDGFPVLVGPDLTYNGGAQDTFVAKVSSDGTQLLYCGYIGGDEYDYGREVAVDPQGFAYVAGWTASTETTFPVVVGPDLTYNGGIGRYGEGFVAKVSQDGSQLLYCGYIGGDMLDACFGIDVDDTGHAFVTGHTSSTEATFPVAVGPDLTFNGKLSDAYGDAFVAKLTPDGTQLLYCGYIGGANGDRGWRIKVDDEDCAYMGGFAMSDADTFPVKAGPDLTWNGNADGFVAKVSADGTDLLYCGYIGGQDIEQVRDVAMDDEGSAYLVGWTKSTENTFPVTVGPDLTYNGDTDAFVAKVPAHHILLRRGNVIDSTTGEQHDTLFVNGDAGDTNRVVTIPAGQMVSITIDVSPNGPNPARYALYCWLAEAGPNDWVEQDATLDELGTSCFPLPFNGAPPQLLTVMNTIGLQHLLGIPIVHHTPDAPMTTTQRYLQPGIYTIQAILENTAPGNQGFSMSNAVVIHQL